MTGVALADRLPASLRWERTVADLEIVLFSARGVAGHPAGLPAGLFGSGFGWRWYRVHQACPSAARTAS
jgi:hypothetical protein